VVKIQLVLENFGYSAAVSVFQAAELVDNDALPHAADQSCQIARAQAGIKIPGTVFLDSKIRHTGQTIFPQQKVEFTTTDSPIKPISSVLYAVGCVIYRDNVTDGIWWTRFCQETSWLASSYKSGQPLIPCKVYNETGKYEIVHQ
jgi:hypothetical protein